MDIASIIQSLMIGISIATVPGPIFFELVRRVITRGFWSGVSLTIGEFLGNFTLFLGVFFGLSSLNYNPFFQISVHALGGSILIWLGIIAQRLKESDIDKPYGHKVHSKNSLLAGLSIALTSPIGFALWVSLSGSYITKFTSSFLTFLHIFYVAFGFVVFSIPLAFLIHSTKQKIPSKYIVFLSKIFGLTLWYYGGLFLYKFFILVTTFH